MRIPSFQLVFLLIFTAAPAFAQNTGNSEGRWKAGVSRVDITPKQDMPMAGFASRTHNSEGMIQSIWAKALVLEDSDGKRAVMISSDLLGFPKLLSDNIRNKLKTRFGLNRDQIMLNSSHTHSGPVLDAALTDIYILNKEQLALITRYSGLLEEQIVNMVGEAIKNLEIADLFIQNGVTRFQVNRRNNSAALLTQLSELQGPNDYAVPVIKVLNSKGDIKAIAFGYACHPTVLSGYQFSGDYPGFTQTELEKAHPGATALFFQGAGADQNPLPRNTIPLARQYGKELAAAVERVLEEDMKKIPSKLVTTYSELSLPLDNLPTEADLNSISKTSDIAYQKRWADRMLAGIKAGEKRITSYPYPVQVWTIGNHPLVSFGGELVVGYAISVKQMLGADAIILGYSNDVMNYIPTSTILKEGGYEGDIAHVVYGLPAKWQPGIEANILNEVRRLAVEVGLLRK